MFHSEETAFATSQRITFLHALALYRDVIRVPMIGKNEYRLHASSRADGIELEIKTNLDCPRFLLDVSEEHKEPDSLRRAMLQQRRGTMQHEYMRAFGDEVYVFSNVEDIDRTLDCEMEHFYGSRTVTVGRFVGPMLNLNLNINKVSGWQKVQLYEWDARLQGENYLRSVLGTPSSELFARAQRKAS